MRQRVLVISDRFIPQRRGLKTEAENVAGWTNSTCFINEFGAAFRYFLKSLERKRLAPVFICTLPAAVSQRVQDGFVEQSAATAASLYGKCVSEW